MKATKLTVDEIKALEKIENHNVSIIREFGLINIAQLNLNQRNERAEKKKYPISGAQRSTPCVPF